MSTHVCLVSEQLIPNVLPVLAERPRQVVLLITPQMENQGRLLEKLLRERRFKTVSHPIPAYDFAGVLATCTKVIKDCRTTGETITLNVTGGTKIAALAAYQQFYFESHRIIYTDTANSRILELGDAPTAVSLTENLFKVKDYLACYGKYLNHTAPAPSSERVRQRRQATSRLCQILVQNPSILRELNWHVSEARRQRPQTPFTLSSDCYQGKGGLIGSLLVQAGIAVPVSSREVRIEGDDNLFYLNGGWLEEFVYNTIVDMDVAGLNCRLNVNIRWENQSPTAQGKTTNELDVAFTHRNRLHIISCKTSGLDKGGPDPVKGKEALYELDSMADNVGGLFARSMLVSVHPPHETSCRRAKDLGIEIVAGQDILAFGRHLQQIWGLSS
ncbi:MAG: DUF1887 family CARF protein [bacterium]|nr:DUF1887 family CARF protein [bacterium]